MVGDPLHVPKCPKCHEAMRWTPRGRFFCGNIDCPKCDKKYKKEVIEANERLRIFTEKESKTK